jgi:two-component system, OmpR family, sensor histidine kinase ArlS
LWFLLYRILKPVSENIKAKENFVANAHHELKTPLTVIKSELELFDKSNLTTLQNKEIQGLKIQVEKMINLTNHLLTNLTKNQEILLNSKILLSEVILNSIDIISTIYIQNNLKINISSNLDIEIKTNDVLFKQLILNIIENAFKHTQTLENKYLNIELNEKKEIIFTNPTNKSILIVGNGLKAMDFIANELGLNAVTLIENNQFTIILRL